MLLSLRRVLLLLVIMLGFLLWWLKELNQTVGSAGLPLLCYAQTSTDFQDGTCQTLSQATQVIIKFPKLIS